MVRVLPAKIHHLIRYCLLLSVLALTSYHLNWQLNIFFAVLGPPIFISSLLKTLLTDILGDSMPAISNMAYAVPITLAYFGISGFLLKELWNERGPIRFISLVAFAGFLIFIHVSSWIYIRDFSIVNS